MKTATHLLSAFLFVALPVSAAQLYRWVDSKGNVEWRDTPPPSAAAAKKIEQRKMGDNAPPTSEVQFSVQLAAKNHPVTLWATSDCGKPCDLARAHLSRRGTPFTERNPSEDLEAFKKLSGGTDVPYVQVGVIRVKGYLESELDNTLDSAGYPRTVLATQSKPAASAPQAKPPADKPAAAAPTAK